MKKSSIRGVVLGLALVTALGSTVMLNSVSSAKMKLNKTKIAINIGKTYKLKLNGTKKKVKWNSSKPYVASVTKKGVVKGWTAGTTNVTAKAGKKKCVCKVIVKTVVAPQITPPPVAPTQVPVAIVTTPAPNTNTTTYSNGVLATNIAVTTNIMQDGDVLFTIKNNNTICVNSVQINYQLKNANGEVVKISNFFLGVIEAGATTYDTETIPSGFVVDITKTVATVAVDQFTWRQSANANVTVTHAKMAVTSPDKVPGISLTITNRATHKATVEGVVLFYNAAGQIIAANRISDYIEPGATVMDEVYAPYDSNYDDIPYASYSVITNSYVSIY